MLLQQFDDPRVGADNSMHSRDERFRDQARPRANPDPLCGKAHRKKIACLALPLRRASLIADRSGPALAFEKHQIFGRLIHFRTGKSWIAGHARRMAE